MSSLKNSRIFRVLLEL
uniref:Uncharacterized protein n=1 Tax=Romanomermis culicivorax TaxID=13658 RepID=A0A915JRP9_ROMCU